MSNLLQIQTADGQSNGLRYIFFGEVVSIDDPFESREIKVRIPEIDYRVENDGDLPPCYPVLPPFLHFVPKVGERVMVFLDRLYSGDKSINQEKRYYISVMISQPQNINFDAFYYTANSNESDGWVKRTSPVSQIPQARGVYPRKTDVGLIGRDNTDILLRDGEILLRAGKHENGDYETFNRKNPSFIQIRHGLNNSAKEIKTRTITKLEQIPPDYTIKVIVDDKNRLLIKVIEKSTNIIKENFSASYSSKQALVAQGKDIIRSYQTTYPKWELRTVDDEFADLPTIFPNNSKFVKQEVEFNEDGQFKEFAGSCINVVSEKINFLSRKSANNLNVTDPDQQIDDATQTEMNSTLHPMVYGDRLIEFMQLMKDYVKGHSHPFAGLPPVSDEITKKILNFNLENLVDTNIRLG